MSLHQGELGPWELAAKSLDAHFTWTRGHDSWLVHCRHCAAGWFIPYPSMGLDDPFYFARVAAHLDRHLFN